MFHFLEDPGCASRFDVECVRSLIVILIKVNWDHSSLIKSTETSYALIATIVKSLGLLHSVVIALEDSMFYLLFNSLSLSTLTVRHWIMHWWALILSEASQQTTHHKDL